MQPIINNNKLKVELKYNKIKIRIIVINKIIIITYNLWLYQDDPFQTSQTASETWWIH